MNRGEARRKNEETGWEDARALFPSLTAPARTPSVTPVSSTRRARSGAETLRGTADPFASGEATPSGGAEVRRDWCVDRGDQLLTMSTFELWAAIERAEVAPWMRVWREGMECWAPAGELLELSWAVAGTPQPSVESEAITGPAPLPPEPTPAPRETSRVPERASVSREASRVPDRATASREVPPAQPREQVVSQVQTRGARWVTVGSLVAAASIAAAFFFAAGGGAEGPTEPVSASLVSPVSASVVAAPPAGRVPEPPALDAPTVEDPPRPEPARREERGQRRLPRGGGRAYGR